MGFCLDHLYPLTSLQIGDMKANISRAFLYFAPDSHKFLILVDNQSWRRSKHSRSTLMKEFAMTSYRTSPFINTGPLLRSSSFCSSNSLSHETKTESLFKWFPIPGMSSWRERSEFSIEKLLNALHGFIVFEASWKDVRGIKYLNELQTDTSLALEVKSLTKWEFDGIDQASSCVTSWFSGTLSETQTLRTNLINLKEQIVFRSAEEITSSSNDPLQDKLLSEEEFFDVSETSFGESEIYMDHQLEEQDVVAHNHNTGPIGYEDILLLCRFNDKDLPSELTKIITPDLKLLTLLESGLPSWVIFLQSYPLLCALYRPWMRPLYKTLYIFVSLVTVIIGFYDLYKNVPLLKATVSHLCGPLFNWIESWDMISRIKYLGTMLFLQNIGKAAKMFLSIIWEVKLLISQVTRTLMYPVEEMVNFLMPLWSFVAVTANELLNTGLAMVEFFRSVTDALFDVFIPPLKVVCSHLSSLASWFNPIVSSLLELFIFSAKACLLLANCVKAFFHGIYEVLEFCLLFAASNMSHLRTYFLHFKPDSSEFSFWHSLWKDLFLKVLRSVRSIVRVLSAFIASCKRHRLSIYNHQRAKLRQFGFYSPKVDAKECEDCKRQ